MAAFASERMLVIDKADEIFGLEKHFLPVTQTCANEKIPATPYDWPTATNHEKIVKFCPNSKEFSPSLGQFNVSMVPYLPKDLFDLSSYLHRWTRM
jgi:hypothetical protein